MYYVRVKKVAVNVDPWNLLNVGFLSAIPRLKLHIILNYNTRIKEKHQKREFHIASVSAEQIITDHLYQMKNKSSESAGVADSRILAGIERHYVKGAIKLEKEEVVQLVYNKYEPEKNLIIQQFKDNAPDYKFIIK